nr:ribonuclease H-like domain-containing protein [Tanacetum cinerariifolium]
MNLEMEAHNRNGTWVVTDLLVGRKPIGGKWVFKIKYESNGEVDRFKAIYVTKGYNQKKGIDYEEIFSHVVKIVTVRCILPLVVFNSWPVYQLDVNNAFYGVLVEDVYMSLPEGYFSKDDKRVCKLSHLKLAFRVLRYLKTAPDKGISFSKGTDLNLKVYVDPDWAKCKVTRKSITGYAVFMGKSLVSWKSKKQSMLSKSSAKPEYMAMNSVTCEVMWILKVLAELNIKTSLHVPLHCDNNSAIQIAAKHVFHERTKHFEIELFFLREKVADGVVKTVKIKLVDNIADIFTKCLSVVDHNRFCENLGMYDMYMICLRVNIEDNKPNPVSGSNDVNKSETQR